MLARILLIAFKQIAMGALWALGAAIIDYLIKLHKKGSNVLARVNLLFHPSVTRIAVLCSALLNLSGLFAALGAAGAAWKGLLGDHGTQVACACVLAGILCAQVAGWGRSTVAAVDNNQVPK